MPPRPETPPELQDRIVNLLEDGQEGLCEASTASRRLNTLARHILFRTVEAQSIDRIVRLYRLLENKQCTIPVIIDHLIIQCEHPQTAGNSPHDALTFSDALGAVLDHFQVQVSITLNLPWVLSRHRDLVDLWDHTQLKNLILRGCYYRTSTITEALAYLPNLEVLVVDASFKSTSEDGQFYEEMRGRKANDFLSPGLKELVLSPEALAMMHWMCLLGAGRRPKDLHVIRLKIDDIRHTREIYKHLEQFFAMYGPTVVHVYLWFEETWDWPYRGDYFFFCVDMQRLTRCWLHLALGEGLRHAPNLRQLEVLLPSVFDDIDVARFAASVCAHVRPSTRTRVRAGDAIGLDEREFWETPSLTEAQEGFASPHTGLMG
ncbi:hypothetical protein NMY22_g10970 [Coprinellus aureogranulatus]|nr:hypothetical protein NMY22_g10970 [Coprinellus aureogranulatus]